MPTQIPSSREVSDVACALRRGRPVWPVIASSVARARAWAAALAATAAIAGASLGGCAKDPTPFVGGSGSGGAPGATTTPPTTVEGALTVSLANPTPVASSALGLNYWSWTYGVTLSGTETLVAALGPGLLRVGGHNNDWNSPSPFSDTELDRAIAYARTVGAEPIIQVPVLDDVNGMTPTADTAAAMVRTANVTRAYGVKYFSVGNEPDIYADPTQTPRLATFTADNYCQIAEAFVPAMRAVDPTIKILGPELSWKYQDGTNDWLTPILRSCGDLFDIVSIHRYPIDPAKTLRAAVAADAASFHATIMAVRQKMVAAGQGEKPLAVTETNVTWNGDPAISTLEASPGTLPAGLWVADTLGTGLVDGLWTTAFWSIREGYTFGILTPDNVARPAYQAIGLFRNHFGNSLLSVTSAPSGVHAYASRNAAGDATELVIVNWTDNRERLSVTLTGGSGALAASPPPPTLVEVEPMTMTAVEMPDSGASIATWSYGQAEWQAHAEPTGSN